MSFYIRPFEYLPETEYRLLLAALKEDGRREYGIIGWQAIAVWLYTIGFVRRPPVKSTIVRWVREYFMPACNVMLPTTTSGAGRRTWRGPLLTTNLALHAWMVTQGRAVTLPRWHPYRLAVYTRTPCEFPVRAHPNSRPRGRQSEEVLRERYARRQESHRIREARRRDRIRSAQTHAEVARWRGISGTLPFLEGIARRSTDTVGAVGGPTTPQLPPQLPTGRQLYPEPSFGPLPDPCPHPVCDADPDKDRDANCQ